VVLLGRGGGQIFLSPKAFRSGLVPNRSLIQQETGVLSAGMKLMEREGDRSL